MRVHAQRVAEVRERRRRIAARTGIHFRRQAERQREVIVKAVEVVDGLREPRPERPDERGACSGVTGPGSRQREPDSGIERRAIAWRLLQDALHDRRRIAVRQGPLHQRFLRPQRPQPRRLGLESVRLLSESVREQRHRCRGARRALERAQSVRGLGIVRQDALDERLGAFDIRATVEQRRGQLERAHRTWVEIQQGRERSEQVGAARVAQASKGARAALVEPRLRGRLARGPGVQLGGVSVVEQDELVDLAGLREAPGALLRSRAAGGELDESITQGDGVAQGIELRDQRLADCRVLGVDGEGRAKRAERLSRCLEARAAQLRARELQVDARGIARSMLQPHAEDGVDLPPSRRVLVQSLLQQESVLPSGRARHDLLHEGERTVRLERGEGLGGAQPQAIGGGRVRSRVGLLEQGAREGREVAATGRRAREAEHGPSPSRLDPQHALVSVCGSRGVARQLLFEERDRLEVGDAPSRVDRVLRGVSVHRDAGAGLRDGRVGGRLCEEAEQAIDRLVARRPGHERGAEVLDSPCGVAERFGETRRANQVLAAPRWIGGRRGLAGPERDPLLGQRVELEQAIQLLGERRVGGDELQGGLHGGDRPAAVAQ